jgi:hypothetical protein
MNITWTVILDNGEHLPSTGSVIELLYPRVAQPRKGTFTQEYYRWRIVAWNPVASNEWEAILENAKEEFPTGDR